MFSDRNRMVERYFPPQAKTCKMVHGTCTQACYSPFNDMRDVSKVLDFILFADDTNIFFSHKNVNVIVKSFKWRIT